MFLGVLGVSLNFIIFRTSLEAELEELRYRLGRALDFIGAHSSSLAERLDNVSCHVQGVVGFGVSRGAVVALLVGELRFGCRLWEVIDPP